MSFFNEYPYRNITDLNLDWLLNAIRTLRHDVDDFVTMNAIKYADPIDWSITTQYEKNTVVIDANTGVAYLSVAAVPAGVNITRPEYWTVIFDLSRFTTAGVSNLANSYESQLTYTATVETAATDWVMWNGTLYEALNDIHVGDRYVPDGNIKKTTVEEFVSRVIAAINTEIQNRIDADAALQQNIDDEILARTQADNTLQTNIDNVQQNVDNEASTRALADQALKTDIGDLDDLSTTDKSNLVNAINEVNSTGGGAIGMIGDLDNLNTTDKSNVVSAVNEVNVKANNTIDTIGDINNLNTPSKESVVSSINSFYASRNEIVVNVKDFGAVADGHTDDSDAIEAAINSLPASGGVIFFPAGNYAITREIAIGDGQASTTANGHPSTKQNIKLIGAGCSRAYTPQITQITPLNTVDAIMNVHGLINNVVIDGFNLYANGKATYGLFICATNYSTFKNIEVYNPTYCGIALIGGKAPTGNYNTGCKFKQIQVSLNTSSTIGLQLTGDISANNDTWLTTFEDCRFQSMSGTSNCTSGEFRFCDNITFIRCHFVTYSTTGRGIDLNALDSLPNNPFPTGLSFIDCSIANTAITEDVGANKRIGVNRFYGYGITDGEVIPSNDTRVVGFDGNGAAFNGFGQITINSISELSAAIGRLPLNCSVPFCTIASVSQQIFGIGGAMGGIMVRRSANSAELLSFTSASIFYAQVGTAGNLMQLKSVGLA